jgi:quercetin dioxygenase-like cupin family protein
MPILKFDDAPEFDLAGAGVRGLASPSRGAIETMCYRVVLEPGQMLPPHRHDHEEVFHVVSGSLTAVLDGKETAVAEGDTVMIPAGTLHRSFTRESERAVVLAMMPVGTIMIRPDGEQVRPPWGD